MSERTPTRNNHWKGVFQVLDVNNTGRLDAEDLRLMFPDPDIDVDGMLEEVLGEKGDELFLEVDDLVNLCMTT